MKSKSLRLSLISHSFLKFPIPNIFILQGLTVQDFETLGDLARGSSVLREKEKLAILQANVDAVSSLAEEAPALSSGDIKVDKAEYADAESVDPIADKSIKRIHAALDSMLDKLKVKIDTTEKALGDKLKVLDLDGE